MKAYSLTQYHQVLTNTAYFRVILHFLHHRYVFVCTMPIQAHFLGIRLHSFSGPLHLLWARANTHPPPCWPFLTLFLIWGNACLLTIHWLGTSGKAQKTRFQAPRRSISRNEILCYSLWAGSSYFVISDVMCNSFKGYQNCLVSAGLLGSCNP